MNKKTISRVLLASALILFASGCKKKTPPPPPPPPPPPAKPAPVEKPSAAVISSFTVEPSSIQRGQSATVGFAREDLLVLEGAEVG